MIKAFLISLLFLAPAVVAFSPVSPQSPSIPFSSALFHSSSPQTELGDNHDVRVQKEVSRRVALVMAAAVAATGNLPDAEAYSLATKVESIEYENLSTVNSNGAPEKHLPQVEVAENKSSLTVTVPHVMDPQKPHFIEYMWLEEVGTKKVLAVQKFTATDPAPPTLKASINEGTKLKALLYCNLHGLWQGEPLTV